MRTTRLFRSALQHAVTLLVVFGGLAACDDEGAQLDGNVFIIDDTPSDLSLLAIRPPEGPLEGGALVALVGEGFEADMTVLFGEARATQLAVGGHTVAIMQTPPGVIPGAVDVTVTRPSDSQTSVLNGGYNYIPGPGQLLVLESIPNEGPIAGANKATLNGNGFVEGAEVFFGDNKATDVRVLGNEALTLTVPAGSALGATNIRVVLPEGDTHTLDRGYTYFPEGPLGKVEVLGVIPAVGPVAGGTRATVEGKGFVQGTTVMFGNSAATEVRVLGANAISVVVPAGAGPGLVEVRVNVPADETNAEAVTAFLDNAYAYEAAPLTQLSLLNVIPPTGPLAGGNAVALRGSGFEEGTKVFFDGTAALNVQQLGANALTATMPPGQDAGPVDVRVELPNGGDAVILDDGYNYEPGTPPLLILEAIPGSGPIEGGNVVALQGEGFRDGAKVFFGAARATSVRVLGTTAMTVVAPTGAMPGAVDLRVELPILPGEDAGEAYSLEDAYTYLLGNVSGDLSVASLFPAQDKEEGGALVLVTGTGFDPAMTISFGATQAPITQVLSGNAATALVPAGMAGLVDVRLTNPTGEAVQLTNGFRYVADDVAVDLSEPPALGAVQPARGPASGGTIVRVSGSNFAPDARIFFGEFEATEVNIASTSLASAVVPAGTLGSVAVRVVNPDDQEDVLANAFVYANPADAPAIALTSPTTGPTTGGTWVTVDGAGYTTGTTVWFGLTPAATTTVGSTTPSDPAGTRLIAVSPTGVVGSVDLTVVRPDGAFVVTEDAFGYYDATTLPNDPPVVGSVFPRVGDTAGGAQVSVIGSNFDPAARFFFDATEVMVNEAPDGSQRIVTTASHAPGSVGVTVVNPDGLTSTRRDAFVYFAPPPLIIGMTPSVSAASGGTEVTLRGKNFAEGVEVRVGNAAITAFNTASSTELKFFAPAQAPALMDVMVLNPDGQQDISEDAFLYVSDDQFSAPVVTSVEPDSGLGSGGYNVVIRGDNFQQGASVQFGGVGATGVNWLTENVLTAIAPGGTPGTSVDVTVFNSADKSGTLSAAFTYTAAPIGPIKIQTVSPGIGSMTGGTVVTINGEGFETGSKVYVDGVESLTVDVISSSVITAVTPAGMPGLVDIRVERQDLTAATAFNAFAYYDPATFGDEPAISSVDPGLGPLTGNTAVMIRGQRFAGPVQVFFGAFESPQTTVLDSGRIVARTPVASRAGSVAVSVINFDGLIGVQPGGFSYYDASGATAPTLVTVLPPDGSVFGGTEATVVGENLSPGGRVYICERPATIRGASGGTQLTIVTPAGDPGPCVVTVVNPDGLTADRADAYTYKSPNPIVTEVIPRIGAKEGGIDVVIRGDNFVPGATVRFGNAESPRVQVADPRTLTATLPPANVGVVNVTVINPGGAQSTLTAGFEYVDSVTGIPPNILQIAPASGPLAGGTPVQVLGQNFDPDALVLFDQQTLTDAEFVSTSEIRFVTPPAQGAGSVSITILNPDGLGATVPNGFTFANPQADPPIITSLVPSTGRESGGTTITITGSNFSADGTWRLGGKALVNVAFVNSSLVTARTPPGVPGTVDLVYVGPDGQVALRLQAFEYLAAPVLTAVTPALGGVSGGNQLNLVGDNFETGMTVFFGSSPGQVLTVESANSALVRTPSAQSPGFVDVKVRNPDGQEGLIVNGFEYLLPPNLEAVWPPSGPSPGGTLLTLTGTGFHPGSQVFVGPDPAGEVFYSNNNLILAFTPGGTLGPTDVRVQNPDEIDSTLIGGFTYSDPANLGDAPFVGEIFPSRGPTSGGTRISLDGANFQQNARVILVPNPAIIEANLGDRIIAVAPAHDVGPSKIYVVNPDGQTIQALEDFTYLDPAQLGTPPIVGSVDPVTGRTSGGTTVNLIGTNFQTDARVRFGALDATTESGSTAQMQVLTPAQDAGSTTIWLVNPDGTQALAPATFEFLPPPNVIGINPSQAPADGGISLTISGTDFLTDPSGEKPSVLFCTDYAQGIDCAAADDSTLFVNGAGTTIGLIAPAHAPGLTEVVVLAPDGQVDIGQTRFSFNALPTIAEIDPSSGPTAGDDPITILGTGFKQGAVVRIGAELCTQTIVASANRIECNTPPGSTGPVEVRVVNPDSGVAAKVAGYTYVPPPIITNVTPPSGPSTGGVTITINGFGFDNTSAEQPQVFIGATEIDEADVTIVSTTAIEAIVPAGAGSNDVKVRNADGQEGLLLDGFTYIPPLPAPEITFITPSFGTTLGGDTVKVVGRNFLDGVRVYFGDEEASDALVKNNGTLIEVLSPFAPVEGDVDVRAVNSDGQEDTLELAYEYIAPLDAADLAFLSIEPSRSVLQGGSVATISGEGFKAGISIRFTRTPAQGGGQEFATEVQRLGPTLISFRVPGAPNNTAGVATVRLVNPGGEIVDAVDAFEFVDGPVFVHHPGDRLPNEPHSDRRPLIFNADNTGGLDVLIPSGSKDRLIINGATGKDGWFAERPFAYERNAFSTREARAADLDNDGDMDIIRWQESSTTNLEICENQGGGDFPTCFSVWNESSCDARDIVVADLNCDSVADIFVACRSTSRTNRLLIGRGDLSFQIMPSNVLPGYMEPTNGIAAADVDGDNDIDLILANDDGVQNRLYFNNCANIQDAGACFPQPPGYISAEYDGRAYVKSTGNTNWDNAEDICQGFGRGSELVRIDDANEDAFLKSIDTGTFWTGLRDVAVDNTLPYEWSQPNGSDFTNFCSGEPNNGNSNYRCIYYETSQSCWRDYPCANNQFRVMCEAPLPLCAVPFRFTDAQYGGVDTGKTFPISAGSTHDAKFLDVNGDTLPDVVFANWGQQTEVFLNIADAQGIGGRFAADDTLRWPQNEDSPYIHRLNFGDIDGDGDTDIIAQANSNQGASGWSSIRVYENDFAEFAFGAFTNATPARWPSGDENDIRTDFNGFAFADLDNDLRPDVYIVGATRTDRMVMNNGYEDDGAWIDDRRVGPGNFRFNTARLLPEVLYNSRGIAIGDLDGINGPDIVKCGDREVLTVHFNDGAGKFIPGTDAAFPEVGNNSCYGNQAIRLVDLDADGDLDILYSGSQYPSSCTSYGDTNDCRRHQQLVNNGTGIFTDVAETNMPWGPMYYSTAIGLGDFDNDGDVDWIEASSSSTYANVYASGGDIFNVGGAYGFDQAKWFRFPNSTAEIDTRYTYHIDVVDLDNDPYPDLYMSRHGQNLVLQNVGGQRFEDVTVDWSNTSADTTYETLIEDFNNDGTKDLIVLNNGANRFHLRQTTTYANLTSSAFPDKVGDFNTRGGAAGDLDQDPQGLVDFVTANHDQQNRLYVNVGGSQFKDITGNLPWDSYYSYGAKLFDVDGDGDLDIYWNNNGQDRMYINTLIP